MQKIHINENLPGVIQNWLTLTSLYKFNPIHIYKKINNIN